MKIFNKILGNILKFRVNVRTKSLANSIKTPLTIIDADRKIIFMNGSGLNFKQLTLREVVGKSYDDICIYPPDSIYCPIKALKEGHEAEALYFEQYNRYFKGTASYLLNKHGDKTGGCVIMNSDVTDIVIGRMNTERQWTIFNTIFNVSPDVIWYQDAQGKYLAANPRFCDIAGNSEANLIDKTAIDVLPPDIAELFIENDSAAISASLPFYTEEKIEFFDGHGEILDSVRTPIYDTAGNFVGLLGFMRDVTARVTIESELRQTQINLEQAVVDANEANEHKSEFLARMSHEIRTPMNAVIGITNIMLKKLDDIDMYAQVPELSEIKVYINQVENSSQHLLGLLNDILDISKIEASKIELSEEETDLLKLANTVTEMIQVRCDEKNIAFKTEFNFDTKHSFITDSLHLRQVLVNLLGNAVKFTLQNGTVEFKIQEKERRDNNMVLLEFSVKDTGVGISGEAFVKIFQPFDQGNPQTAKNFGGTGLGLTISKHIVELFGGKISVDSKVGKGSTFSFSIWMREQQSKLPEEIETSDFTGKFSGKKILLVDDVDINRMIVISLLELEEIGLVIDEAEDGLEALNKFKDSEINEYDIILMDVQMPTMNGYESAAAIRSLERQDASSVPIIALTANAFKEDIDKAISSGMNAHIAKPVELDKVMEVLFKFLKK